VVDWDGSAHLDALCQGKADAGPLALLRERGLQLGERLEELG
jgi:hypothetical protein